jgi:hypothetical protein
MKTLFLFSVAVLGAIQGFTAESWRSPNGQLVCASGLGRERKGEEMWLRLPAAQNRGELVWASEGWLEAIWSPDSKYLAVIDHYGPGQSAVLVFGIAIDDKTKVISTGLLFETPVKERRKQEWEMKGWDLKKGQVFLIKKEGPKKSVISGILSDRPIEQSLYGRDPRGLQER